MNTKYLQNRYDELVKDMLETAIRIIKENGGKISFKEETEDWDEIIVTAESGEYIENIKLCKVSINDGEIFMYSEDGEKFEAINGEHYYYILELLERAEIHKQERRQK